MLWIDLSTFLQLSLIQFVINKYYNFLLAVKSLGKEGHTLHKEVLVGGLCHLYFSAESKCSWIDFSRNAMRLMSSELKTWKIISKYQKKTGRPGKNKKMPKNSVTSCNQSEISEMPLNYSQPVPSCHKTKPISSLRNLL